MTVLRFVMSAISVLIALALPNASVSAAADEPISIVAWGEGLVTGWGLAPGDKFPAKLETALRAHGHAVTVTYIWHPFSKKAVQWLTRGPGQAFLMQGGSRAVILELGRNDCNDFAVDSLERTRSNLDQILAQLAEQNIPALLVGTDSPSVCGPDYAAAYPSIFPDLAKKYDELLYLNFMDGVTGNPDLLQPDGNPNAEGEEIIVEGILPTVEKLIARVGPP